MKLLSSEVSFYDDSFRPSIEPTALGFLRQLTGLSVFDLKGEDQSRTRVVTTLIHGNEPSGFIASHLWMRSASTPKTNLRIIICNPEAALTKPIFTNRFIQHGQDLNRFFSEANNQDFVYQDPVNQDLVNQDAKYQTGIAEIETNREILLRVKQIREAIEEVNPEAIIDLHNTSGSSPAFGVTVSNSALHLSLVSLFANHLILTGLKVGALMEQEFDAPIVTIECGGANDVYSHQIATDGIHEYLTRDSLFEASTASVITHKHPILVRLSGDASVGFGHHQLPTTDITLRADLEKLNQQITTQGEFIGWYDAQYALPLNAIDEQGNNRIEALFEFNRGCIFAKVNMQLFMVTTILEIATKDCLFYATLEPAHA